MQYITTDPEGKSLPPEMRFFLPDNDADLGVLDYLIGRKQEQINEANLVIMRLKREKDELTRGKSVGVMAKYCGWPHTKEFFKR